jgi:hypothetical protein
MYQDLNDFTLDEKRKKEMVEQKFKNHGSLILQQINDKKGP